MVNISFVTGFISFVTGFISFVIGISLLGSKAIKGLILLLENSLFFVVNCEDLSFEQTFANLYTTNICVDMVYNDIIFIWLQAILLQ